MITWIDLSKPFHLPPGASFTATQGPDVEDPNGDESDRVPGKIHLCVRAPRGSCAPNLDDLLKTPGEDDDWSEAHYLQVAQLVYPNGAAARPVLYLQVGSFHGPNGNQLRAAEIVAYRTASRRFESIFREQFGLNNNEEARFIDSGPLRGAMITAEPTWNAPFGYWVAVHRLTPDYSYKQVLRYRSATRYNDGNPLAVIDSEMPNILRRLGLWRRGQPLPLPESRCPRPRLVKQELWCS
ncbi:MAG TPA: hypothetical protein VF079_10490 [Sphingomicrobium sp.]